jgi:hypothetical protein
MLLTMQLLLVADVVHVTSGAGKVSPVSNENEVVVTV